MNTQVECPKCKKSVLGYSSEDNLFVCSNCGSKFYKDAVLNSESSGSLYVMPSSGTAGEEISLPVQKKEEIKLSNRNNKKTRFSLKKWLDTQRRKLFTKKWQGRVQRKKEFDKLVKNSTTDFQRQNEIDNLKFSKKGSK